MKMLATAGLLVACAGSANAQLRISQVFPGGGFSSTNPNADYVQIMNTGATSINIDPFSVQIASATGSAWSVVNLPSFVLQPGKRYLIQLAAPQAQGTALSPDFTAALSNSTWGSAGGKVAIVNGNAALTGSCPVGGSTIVDFFGAMQSTATVFCGEGNAYDAAFGSSNPLAYTRKCNGYQDTNDNDSDFEAVTLNPQNSSAAASSQLILTASAPTPSVQRAGQSMLFTANVQICTPGSVSAQSVSVDLSGSGGPSNAAMNDSGANGDATAGDGIWSYTYDIAVSAPVGGTTATITLVDNQSRVSQVSTSYTVLPPPPANDECFNAETISLAGSGPWQVNGSYADSNFATFNPSSCGLATGLKDVWYTVTPSVSGVWTFTTCPSAVDIDTVISVHTNCPFATGDAQIACADDNGNCLNRSLVDANLQADVTYWVRVGALGGFTGTDGFTLEVQAPPAPPANDECSGAVALPPDSTLSQTIIADNLGATTGDQGVIACTGLPVENDVYYLWTSPPTDGNNGNWTITATNGGIVGIYPASACPISGDGNAELVACHATGLTASVLPNGLQGNTQYLIQIGDTTPRTASTVTITFAPFTGVCCISGQPSIDTQSGCALAGGTYSGDNTIIGAGTPAIVANGNSFAIADLATQSDTIAVTDAGTITNLLVTIDATHTFMADLDIKLVNDDTAAEVFIAQDNGGANNLAGLYVLADTATDVWGTIAANGNVTPGFYKPGTTAAAATSLDATFGGGTVAGNWRLQIVDDAGIDIGNVNSWSLGFNYTNDVCGTGPSCNDLDFNNDGQIEPGDVDAYFSILGEGPCLGDTGSGCDSLDFNNDGNIEPEDVDAYFSVLGEGPCIDN